MCVCVCVCLCVCVCVCLGEGEGWLPDNLTELQLQTLSFLWYHLKCLEGLVLSWAGRIMLHMCNSALS